MQYPFLWYDTTDSNNKGNKVKFMIDHFNEVIQNAMANSPNQNIDEHIDNFVSSPNLIQTFLKHVHCIGTVWSNKKNMPTFSPEKKLKRGVANSKHAKM